MENRVKINFEDHEHDIFEKSRSTYIPDRAVESDDIAQELRISIWLVREKYDSKRASARTFLQRIMKNKIIDLFRHAMKGCIRRRAAVDDFDEENSEWGDARNKEWDDGANDGDEDAY